MKYILAILFGYFLGCSSMSFYLSKWKKVDIRSHGSKNLGASNAMILMGWKAGILVALHDIGKAALAVILAQIMFPNVVNIGGFFNGCSGITSLDLSDTVYLEKIEANSKNRCIDSYCFACYCGYI